MPLLKKAIPEERAAFDKTPAGQARLAYERGDYAFQCSVDVTTQQVGDTTSETESVVLASICHQGWELVGSFVSVEQGQRGGKVASWKPKVAIRGARVGYYLFARCEANCRETGSPWQ